MPSPSTRAPSGGLAEPHDDVIYPSTTAFLVAHLACFGAIWTGVTVEALALGLVLYLVRMFGITAGYHRYFSHRSFKTSRVFQFVLGFLAQSSAQRGVLWWAAKHRWHHLHSDTELDVHSPARRGFFYAHMGWIFTARHHETDHSGVPDLARWPELVWLDRHPYLAAIVLGVGSWLIAGWPGLVVGFFWSTVALWHATFGINSLAHVLGNQRYITGDDSRNNWLLAIFTLGEGWHNNHHACQSSVRQGFRWWQYDPTFYTLRALSWLGLVWDLQLPPRSLVAGEQRLGRKVVDRVAHQLAGAFPIERIAGQARDALSEARIWQEFRSHAQSARGHAASFLGDLHLPHMPSLEQVRHLAEARLARTPSLDDIARRTRQVLLETIATRLLKES